MRHAGSEGGRRGEGGGGAVEADCSGDGVTTVTQGKAAGGDSGGIQRFGEGGRDGAVDRDLAGVIGRRDAADLGRFGIYGIIRDRRESPTNIVAQWIARQIGHRRGDSGSVTRAIGEGGGWRKRRVCSVGAH